MSQDCCQDTAPGLISVEQAQTRILEAITPLSEQESLPVEQALGRVLAEDLHAPIDVPGHPNSAMDGYALRHSALPAEPPYRLRVVGTALAGHPYTGAVADGEAVRIMTGAVVPEDCDSVVMQEQVRVSDTEIEINAPIKAGQHVRPRGEDLRQGQIVMAAGTRLTPPHLGLLASLGLGQVTLRRRPRVAVVSTGDELYGPGTPLPPGGIYDSNRVALVGLLQQLPVEILDLGRLADDPDAIRAAFAQAREQADVLITSGGVSVGTADFVTDILREQGQVDFWRIAVKPGKPLAFGQLGNCHLFGLPGNPVSALVTFLKFVRPALQRLGGGTPGLSLRLQAQCQSHLRHKAGRTEFQRGILEPSAAGAWQVRSSGGQGSGMLGALAAANCLIEIPATQDDVEAGTEVRIEPLPWWD